MSDFTDIKISTGPRQTKTKKKGPTQTPLWIGFRLFAASAILFA